MMGSDYNQPREHDNSTMELRRHAAAIVEAYVANQPLPPDAVADLLTTIYHTLSTLGVEAEPAPMREPAVPVKKSVTDDYIVCLEDGAKLKMLKRYLRTHFDLSPEEYRARWNLPADYPMVAPVYSRKRSEFARKSGLGRPRGDD